MDRIASDLDHQNSPNRWERIRLFRYVAAMIRSVKQFSSQVHKLPIVVFYRYMWLNNKSLLFRTILFNYMLQFILELLPWWASKRRVGNKLQTSRIKLSHNMVTGRDFQKKLLVDFLIKTFLFALLDSLNRYAKNRVNLENKFEIRRLVLEKILYAEIPELEKITRSYSGSLEDKVARDITNTLNYVNNYLPSLVSSAYALIVESGSIWRRRHNVHFLAFVYPGLIFVGQRLARWAQYRLFLKGQKKLSKNNNERLDEAMSLALGGIIDIQTNNLQAYQLAAFDTVTQEEVRNKEGLGNFVHKSWSALHQLNAFSYALEVYCVHRIMKQSNLDHKQYSKIQQEIDRLFTFCRRIYLILSKTKNIFKTSSKVISLLNIPTFIDEADRFAPLTAPFQELVVDCVKFSYSPEATSNTLVPDLYDPETPRPAFAKPHIYHRPLSGLPGSGNVPSNLGGLVLDIEERLVFSAGCKYAIVGQNRAGKSTITKLLTKLYTPQEGEIYWNDIPYSQISRIHFRDLVSYIPQTPLIAGGTIRENILMGNPNATEDQILFAAEASGILDFLRVLVPPQQSTSSGSSTGSLNNSSTNSSIRSSSSSVGSGEKSSKKQRSSSVGMSMLVGKPDKSHKHKKSKKKSKKNKKHSSSSDDDFEDDSGFARTLSFAELAEIGTSSLGYRGSKFDDNGSTGDDDDLDDYDSNEDSLSSSDEDDKSSVDSDSYRSRTPPPASSSTSFLNKIPFISSFNNNNQQEQMKTETTTHHTKHHVKSNSGLAHPTPSTSSGHPTSSSQIPVSASTPNLQEDLHAAQLGSKKNSSTLQSGGLFNTSPGSEIEKPPVFELPTSSTAHKSGQNYSGGLLHGPGALATSSHHGATFSSKSHTQSSSIPKSVSSGNLNRMSSSAGAMPRMSRKALRAEQLKVLDKVLEAGGGDLSGGFAQSVALARVFVRTSAKVVILDESTSHMDPVKLRMTVFPKLLDFVEKWGMCLIVITHHFNAIRDFDQILVMHEGRVVHQGTHDELVDQHAELYLQLNPANNNLLSYHSRIDLQSLGEDYESGEEEDEEGTDDAGSVHCWN